MALGRAARRRGKDDCVGVEGVGRRTDGQQRLQELLSLRFGQARHQRGLHSHDLREELVDDLTAIPGEGDKDLSAVVRVG